jgi:hypothetical protein
LIGLRRTYISYQHDGAKWAFDIKATSPEDAKVRLAKIAGASYDGELVATVNIPRKLFGWLYRWWIA